MYAELQGLRSPDVDLQLFQPANPECFSVLLQMSVGPVGVDSGEVFVVLVCTPSWVAEEVRRRGGQMTGRHLLIVEEWSLSALHDFLARQVSAASGDDWGDVAQKVGRLGLWEFEDYTEAPA